MNILIPFILSAIIPGTGQLFNKQYFKGTLFLLLPFFIVFFVQEVNFLYPFLISTILSLTDLYLAAKNKHGRAEAMRNLIFGILTVIVIIPALIYLFSLSMIKGLLYTEHNILNDIHTENEMKEIMSALESYRSAKGHYPVDYMAFVKKKPIRSHWKTDFWGNLYEYQVDSTNNVMLRSIGKDELSGTADDLVISTARP